MTGVSEIKDIQLEPGKGTISVKDGFDLEGKLAELAQDADKMEGWSIN